MKYLLSFLLIALGCTITTEVVVDKKAIAELRKDPIELRVTKEWTVSEQDELLLRLTELNPDAEPKEFIAAYEYIAGEPYRAVIQRHMGNVLGPGHPYRWGDLSKDHKTNGMDVSVCNLAGGRMW